MEIATVYVATDYPIFGEHLPATSECGRFPACSNHFEHPGCHPGADSSGDDIAGIVGDRQGWQYDFRNAQMTRKAPRVRGLHGVNRKHAIS